jgi:hypothetical protein
VANMGRGLAIFFPPDADAARAHAFKEVEFRDDRLTLVRLPTMLLDNEIEKLGDRLSHLQCSGDRSIWCLDFVHSSPKLCDYHRCLQAKSYEDIALVLWSFQGAVPSTAEESAFLWFRVNYESLIGKDFMCKSGCWIGKILLLLPFF